MEVNMKEVKIPQGFNPFKIKVNNVTYEYKPGEIVEVPDDVAEVIENYESYQNEDPAKKEWVEGFAFDPVADAGKAVMVNENGKLSLGEDTGGGGKGSGGAGTTPMMTVMAIEDIGSGTKHIGFIGYFCQKDDIDKWYGPNDRTTDADYLILPGTSVENVVTSIVTNQKTIYPARAIPSDNGAKLIFIPNPNMNIDVTGASYAGMVDYGSAARGYIISGDFTVTISR
jgi:hypothetical protein